MNSMSQLQIGFLEYLTYDYLGQQILFSILTFHAVRIGHIQLKCVKEVLLKTCIFDQNDINPLREKGFETKLRLLFRVRRDVSVPLSYSPTFFIYSHPNIG